jgi:hypothetical protein
MQADNKNPAEAGNGGLRLYGIRCSFALIHDETLAREAFEPIVHRREEVIEERLSELLGFRSGFFVIPRSESFLRSATFSKRFHPSFSLLSFGHPVPCDVADETVQRKFFHTHSFSVVNVEHHTTP